jgi:hypothetical protein
MMHLARESTEHNDSIRASESDGGITGGDNFL